MQYAVLALMLVWMLERCRCIRQLRAKGKNRTAMRVYRRTAILLAGMVWGAMAAQEAVLWRSGGLTLATGLPLHLCSLMGVLMLPMLLTRSRPLWYAAVYMGIPGALLALVFPAVADTPWPLVTELSFFVMHAGIAAAPLLPASLGCRLQPSGAAAALVLLLCASGIAMMVNGATGGNYLFLAGPVAGTPLMLLAGADLQGYRLRLAVLAVLMLALEGAGVCMLKRIGKRKASKSRFS